jgi:CheY-like chemotaxis protein
MEQAVLVVDDEPMIREILGERLQGFNVKILEAGNGKEALQQLRANPHIVSVVSDIQMPQMNGVQFIRAAREEGFNQPFIFFTAFTSRETIVELARHKVHSFIEKGGMDGVEEAVEKALRPDATPDFDIVEWFQQQQRGPR